MMRKGKSSKVKAAGGMIKEEAKKEKQEQLERKKNMIKTLIVKKNGKVRN